MQQLLAHGWIRWALSGLVLLWLAISAWQWRMQPYRSYLITPIGWIWCVIAASLDNHVLLLIGFVLLFTGAMIDRLWRFRNDRNIRS
ncbi:hypothetical protein EV138_4996 [Kribbella voronezhensis]|uniref:Uncharacterized protein n=1 Tax=Kribbella voronezhensis TaxID=2512212 RepID=A0A4R7TGM5_9ACTN|nr:hypothetical protein [Kribbella voronezhensis]TDU91390.1 hypothetical protein EV138_4996 [Kribbella voronezhensis]